MTHVTHEIRSKASKGQKGNSIMKNFIKKNVKLVITMGISLMLIAGLTTALVLTNVTTGHARDRDRTRSSARMELTEEQIAERMENRRERLQQRLVDGSITQEEYDSRIAAIESGERVSSGRSRSADGEDRGERRTERTPLTEEQIAERTEKLREKLAQELAAGNITQAEYDEKIIAVENGEFRGLGRNRANKSDEAAATTASPQATTT